MYVSGRIFAAMLGIIVLTTSTEALQMCTSADRLTVVERGKVLTDSQILNMTTTGIMTCSRACLTRRRCKSFNFGTDTGECQLNSRTNDSGSRFLTKQDTFVFSDISHWPERLAGACANHICPLDSYCDPVNKTHHVCRITFCLDSPNVENGHFGQEPDASPIGKVLPLICDPGYIPKDEVVCQGNGTWSSPVCVSVSSCSMVKQYRPNSEDGEYWLRLTNFNNYTTRFYCYKMTTISPEEYLTLLNINHGIYPQFNDRNCDGITQPLELSCENDGGEIWFHKIKVTITSMEVSRTDSTFANHTNNNRYLDYGTASDCYTEHPSNQLRCGTRGEFTIDLRGTGWKVSEDHNWTEIGYKPMIESINWQMNGTFIIIKCGGYWGGCRPREGLFLTPNF